MSNTTGILKKEKRAFSHILLNEKLQRIATHPAIAFIIFFMLMFGLFSMVTLLPGDDVYFSTVHLSYSLPDYLAMRYTVWSGRLLVDALLYFFTGTLFALWKWFAAACITGSAILIYHMVTYGQKMPLAEKRLFAYLSCFILGLISVPDLMPSVFWVSGSLNYLVPFFVGLVAFLPFFHALKNEDYAPNAWSLLFVIPAVLTMFGQEQVSLCFICFSLIALVYLAIFKKRKISWILWTILAISVAFEVIALAALGNSQRFASEINTWFPTYNEISIYSKITLSLTFVFTTMVDQWYFILGFLWLINGILLLRINSSQSAKIVAYASFFFAMLMVARFITPVDTNTSQVLLTNFNKLFIFHYLTIDTFLLPTHILPYLLWGVGIVLIPLSLILTFKRTEFLFFYLLIFVAALVAILMITFSPTIYASGGRTSFVPNMLLLMLMLFLLRHKNTARMFALPLLGIALIQIAMFYSSWIVNGFLLTAGTLDIKEIPYIVLGR